MAIATVDVVFQRVQVAVPGTSVALAIQPYDNTHTIIFYNRGANAVLISLGAAGGPIAVGGGADLPVGAALTWALGAVSYRPGPLFSSAPIIIDSVGGAGDVSVQMIQAIPQVGPT